MQKPVVYTLMMILLILTAGPLHAGDPEILDFKAPSSSIASPGQVPDEPDLKEGEFDGTGILERITESEVIINDAYYRLSSGVLFKYLDGAPASADNFPVGTRVWFVLYPDNIIKSVWKEGG